MGGRGRGRGRGGDERRNNDDHVDDRRTQTPMLLVEDKMKSCDIYSQDEGTKNEQSQPKKSKKRNKKGDKKKIAKESDADANQNIETKTKTMLV